MKYLSPVLCLVFCFLFLSITGAQEKSGLVWKKDGAEMVYILGGSFEMGDHFGEGNDDETPVHKVELDGFLMDAHEVTVGGQAAADGGGVGIRRSWRIRGQTVSLGRFDQ